MKTAKNILGWGVLIQSPIRVFPRTAKNWRCQGCRRLMRFYKSTAQGYCPKCGGRLRRED